MMIILYYIHNDYLYDSHPLQQRLIQTGRPVRLDPLIPATLVERPSYAETHETVLIQNAAYCLLGAWYGGAYRYLLALLLCSAAGFSAWFTWLILPPISGFAMRLCALTTFLGAAKTKPKLFRFVSYCSLFCFCKQRLRLPRQAVLDRLN